MADRMADRHTVALSIRRVALVVNRPPHSSGLVSGSMRTVETSGRSTSLSASALTPPIQGIEAASAA